MQEFRLCLRITNQVQPAELWRMVNLPVRPVVHDIVHVGTASFVVDQVDLFVDDDAVDVRLRNDNRHYKSDLDSHQRAVDRYKSLGWEDT